MELACAAPAVVCCRCTPTQKATVVRLIQEHTGKRAAAIGDGGNDVSMIQAADTGIGIVGKEGKQVGSIKTNFSVQLIIPLNSCQPFGKLRLLWLQIFPFHSLAT